MTPANLDPKDQFDLFLGSSSRVISTLGLCCILAFFGTVGVWATTSTFAGAVIAAGELVVSGEVKKIQHSRGGTVGELKVKEGDTVAKHQLLVRLDDASVLATLKIIETQLDEFTARRARLEAERDGLIAIALPSEYQARLKEDQFAGLVQAEINLLSTRQAARAGQQEQLRQQIEQLQDQIEGIEAQEGARKRQDVSINDERGTAEALFRDGLITLSRKAALDRAVASIDAQEGQFAAAIAQLKGKIAETKLQIIEIDITAREQVLEELRSIQSKMAELMERRIAAEDDLKRMDMRSPIDGRVHQMMVHTIGGVVSPAETVMLIVPSERDLQIEARVSPSDIDQIEVGKPTDVRMHAFNQRTTPLLTGRVERISPTTVKDPQSGASFFIVRVALSPRTLERALPQRLEAGMQAEVFIKTDDRTPLQFLLKPVQDQYARAFRER